MILLVTSRQLRVAIGCGLLCGCYVQKPITTMPSPGTQIVAQVTDTGVVALANTIGPSATAIAGTVVRADATGWQLRLSRVDQRGGISTPWNGEAVTFPHNALTRISERRLDRKRSWLTAGAIAAAAFVAARAFGALSVGNEPITGDPPQQ